MAANLYQAPTVNFSSTSLNGSINDSVDTFTLNSTTGLQSPGAAVIDRQDSNGTDTPNSREVVTWTGVSGSDLTGVTRGADGSTARSHADGAIFEPILSVGMWNDQRTSLLNALTTGGALDTTKVADLTTAQALSNKTLTSPVINTGVSGTAVLDEDDMASNSATKLATQQSIKAYVDANAGTLATDTLWAAAGDLVKGTGNNTADILSIGAVNAILRSNGTTSAWTAPRFKVGSGTRDLAAATSTVSVTSVGWLPQFMIFYGFVNGNPQLTMGFSDGTNSTYFNYYAADAITGATGLVGKFESGANTVTIGVAFTADGVDITFTKANSPSGTLIYGYALMG